VKNRKRYSIAVPGLVSVAILLGTSHYLAFPMAEKYGKQHPVAASAARCSDTGGEPGLLVRDSAVGYPPDQKDNFAGIEAMGQNRVEVF